jgi:glutamine synthetase
MLAHSSLYLRNFSGSTPFIPIFSGKEEISPTFFSIPHKWIRSHRLEKGPQNTIIAIVYLFLRCHIDLHARKSEKFLPRYVFRGIYSHHAFTKEMGIMLRKRPSELFNQNVFHRKAMGERLPKDVYAKLLAATEGREKLDQQEAGIVAMAMKEWAISRGATHYTHWFHPRTELTAEKHMSFLNVDNEGTPMESFSGKELILSEPDASSLPSGGMRSTFEARGYTAWDPTSPAFIVESERGGTLCIPSVFFSFDGTPLDMKTPLLKAISGLGDRALRLIRLFGNRGVKWVCPTVGPEQEFFLVREDLAQQRPDILLCGRTLLGDLPPKAQQMDDHYFGTINSSVLSFMEEVQEEMAKLGLPLRTRHNEVAPGQFEFAPQFSEANLATDQNQLLMDVMRKVARKHGFRLLLHEKPFAGLNGNGKHVNFSLQDSEGRNLLKPIGNNPKKSLQFLVFLGGMLLGISKFGGLLRASIANPGNMHRLGGNEAPPAVMSVYLGELLTRILEDIEEGLPEQFSTKSEVDLGLNRLPCILAENTDRNRTAPIAFTGDKFEFRAPGASQSIAGPLTAIFAAWSWGIEQMTLLMEEDMRSMDLQDAALKAIRHATLESKKVRFEGNCYSTEWMEEATRRGLPCAQSTPEGLKLYLDPENRALLNDLQIMTEREVFAYYEIRLEQYVNTLDIEIGVLIGMAREGVLPALSRQISMEGKSLGYLPESFREGPWGEMLLEFGELKQKLLKTLLLLESLQSGLTGLPLEEQANRLTHEALPLMEKVRKLSERVEFLMAGDLWPYPRYRDMVAFS